MGTVYFIRAGDGPIKIGYTENNVEHRLSQLQSANAQKLHILATAKGTEKDEKMLHARFSIYSIKGEWFKPSKELLDYIYPIRIFKHEFPLDLHIELEKTEKNLIENALGKAYGINKETAKLLNISKTTLRIRLRKYNL